MFRLKHFLSTLLLLLFCGALHAQKILVFDKGGKEKRVRYYKGSFISFKKSDGILISGPIQSMQDSFIVVLGEKVLLSEIKSIKKTHKHEGFRLFSGVFYTASAAFFTIDSFNRIINTENPVVRRGNIRTSSILFGAATFMSIIGNRSYRMNDSRNLRVLDISI